MLWLPTKHTTVVVPLTQTLCFGGLILPQKSHCKTEKRYINAKKSQQSKSKSNLNNNISFLFLVNIFFPFLIKLFLFFLFVQSVFVQFRCLFSFVIFLSVTWVETRVFCSSKACFCFERWKKGNKSCGQQVTLVKGTDHTYIDILQMTKSY